MGTYIYPTDAKLLTHDLKQVKPESVGQFTNLKDKNKKDIYEGDRNQDGGVVIWSKDDASFCWEYKDVEVQPMGEEDEWCKITGSIYDDN